MPPLSKPSCHPSDPGEQSPTTDDRRCHRRRRRLMPPTVTTVSESIEEVDLSYLALFDDLCRPPLRSRRWGRWHCSSGLNRWLILCLMRQPSRFRSGVSRCPCPMRSRPGSCSSSSHRTASGGGPDRRSSQSRSIDLGASDLAPGSSRELVLPEAGYRVPGRAARARGTRADRGHPGGDGRPAGEGHPRLRRER